ncbi:uncharacterized protein [Halyomorpha halys]|uniref:uncharacterized protein n=1 Tax=Halyomorpha halys TaxID=286706 RepID=UPI0006D4EFD5|nr:uncharacterized protein LOC106682400 [Halyomorpha halys]
MDKDILQSALKRNWKENCLEKIISSESAPAVGKNLNFLSTVERLNLKVVLGNGRVANKSIVWKFQSHDAQEFQNEFNKKYSTFKIETLMYNSLTQIEYIMEEFEDTEDVLWCKMVHHIPYSLIVMEDLKAEGFHLIERNTFYDLDHILLSVHCLGRFHAMCKTLEVRGLAPQVLKNWYVFDDRSMQNYLFWDLVALKDGIKKFWNPNWTPIVEKIKISIDDFQERLRKFSEVDETKFNVTNHGDCHKNNIVIKYSWDKRPISMRFLDFQLVHYGSPCIDLTYMLHLAVEPSVRRKNYDLILRTYHNALVNTLDKYRFQGKKPDINEIRDGMEKHSFFGLVLTLSWYPSLIRSEKMEEIHDFEKIEASGGKEGYSDEYCCPELLENTIGPDIKEFVDRFCKDS